jgi:nuclear GTP-binding protein
MVAKKRASKRQTLQTKYKITKRTKEHARKGKKGKLQVANAGQRKKHKDHIPNAWPYKEELLKDIQIAKEKMEGMKQRAKEKKAEERRARKSGGMHVEYEEGGDAMDEDEQGGGALRHNKYVEGDDEDQDDKASFEMVGKDGGQSSRRAFMQSLKQVTEQADVILHVLDARDPVGTKSTVIEEMVLANYKKKLVFVLNKADLVPKEVLAGWLKFFRQSSPAVPFKCNTQTQRGNLGRAGGKVQTSADSATDGLRTSQAVGADELIGLLKNYARVGDKSKTKQRINVGIVGFPNVGKSSLINSLMRVRSCGVSAVPGFTKQVSEVTLDKNIRLLDSPGVVFAMGTGAGTALRNCINVESMEDVITPVTAILERCPQHYLMQLYSIARFKDKDALSFLALVARGQGKLRKGGVPNTDAAARTVLHDWNSGKIKFYVKAPVVESSSASEGGQILSQFSQVMDVQELLKNDSKVLSALEDLDGDDDEEFVAMDEVGSAAMEEEGDEEGSDDDEDDEDDDDDAAEAASHGGRPSKVKKGSFAAKALIAKSAPKALKTTAKSAKGAVAAKVTKAKKVPVKKAKKSNEDYSFDEFYGKGSKE